MKSLKMGSIRKGFCAAFATAALASLWVAPASADEAAAALAQSPYVEQDCAAILESYAADPKSVAPDAVENCRNLVNLAPAAGAPAEQLADASAVDPCADGGDTAVQCWGPWAAPLAPAAGGAALPAATLSATEYPTRPDVLGIENDDVLGIENDGDPVLEFPVAPCEPGLPCGYATVIDGPRSVGAPEETVFARFELAEDGTSFTVFPVEQDEIRSIEDLQNVYFVNSGRNEDSGGNEEMRSLPLQRSRLIARVLRQGEAIQLAADVWGHQDEDGRVRSGMFAWGSAVEQADIDALITEGAVLSFSGPMSVDRQTLASITLDYGPATWTGSWENPAYEFTAGGALSGQNFLSDSAQFSDNVQDGFVQGSLVGPAEDRGVAHIVEVFLDGDVLVRDVGLLGVATP